MKHYTRIVVTDTRCDGYADGTEGNGHRRGTANYPSTVHAHIEQGTCQEFRLMTLFGWTTRKGGGEKDGAKTPKPLEIIVLYVKKGSVYTRGGSVVRGGGSLEGFAKRARLYEGCMNKGIQIYGRFAQQPTDRYVCVGLHYNCVVHTNGSGRMSVDTMYEIW